MDRSSRHQCEHLHRLLHQPIRASDCRLHCPMEQGTMGHIINLSTEEAKRGRRSLDIQGQIYLHNPGFHNSVLHSESLFQNKNKKSYLESSENAFLSLEAAFVVLEMLLIGTLHQTPSLRDSHPP